MLGAKILTELEYRTKVEKLITVSTRSFTTSELKKIDRVIQNAIKLASKFTEFDRAYIMLFADDLKSLHACFEWVNKDIKPLIESRRQIWAKDYPWLMQQILSKDRLLVCDINKSPKKAVNEQNMWREIGLKSSLLLPIVQHDIRLGYICFESLRAKKSWEKRDIATLQIITKLISQTLERQEDIKKIQNRLSLQNTLFDISRAFATTPPESINKAILNAIASIGKFAGIDYACVVLFTPDKKIMQIQFEWAKKRTATLIKKSLQTPTKKYPWITQQLLNEKKLIITDIKQLPKEAIYEKRKWLKIGYKSLVSIPFASHSKSIGFVSFYTIENTKSWDDQDIAILQIVTELIGQAIERQQIHQALSKSKERFDALFDHSSDGIFIIDTKGRYIDWNFGAESITGHHKIDVIGKTPDKIFDNYKELGVATTKNKLEHITLRALHEKRPFYAHATFKSADNREITIRISAVPIADDYNNIIGAMGIFNDISVQVQKEKLLEKQANIDILTGLYNRRYFDRILPIEYSRATRYDHSLTALFIDIDDFKIYNDSYGHLEGDIVLKKLARVLQDNVRLHDLIFRYGGEEFVILLPETATEDALVVANRIKKIFGAIPFSPKKCMKKKCNIKSLKKTLSIGVAEHNKNTNALEFISSSDKAMYYAKQHGKNKICEYDKIKRRRQ